MQTAVAIQVKNQWGDTKDIKDTDIEINVNRCGEPFYKVVGINGAESFALLMTTDKLNAISTYNQIKGELLEQQFVEMLDKYSFVS